MLRYTSLTGETIAIDDRAHGMRQLTIVDSDGRGGAILLGSEAAKEVAQALLPHPEEASGSNEE